MLEALVIASVVTLATSLGFFILSRFFGSEEHSSAESAQIAWEARRRLLMLMILVGFFEVPLYLVAMGLTQGLSTFDLVVNFGSMVVLLVAALVIRKIPVRHSQKFFSVCLAFCVFVLFLLWAGGGGCSDPSSLMLLGIFPLLAFFLLGLRKGLFWSLLYLLAVASYMMFSYLVLVPACPLGKDWSGNATLLINLVLFFLVVYFYQRVQEKSEKTIFENLSKVEQAKQALEAEAVAREKTEKSLKETKNLLEDQRKALLNVLEDVSQEKVLEEEQSRSLLGIMGEGIVLTDEHALVVYVNAAFERTFGLKSEEVVGKRFGEVFKPADFKKKPLDSSVLEDARSPSKEPVRLYLESSRGKSVPVIMGLSPILVEEEFKGVIRILHDYTEDLALQQQKDDFFSVASHELRTPLTVIAGNLDNVLQGYGGSKLSEMDLGLLKDVISSADRLIAMVNEFLNVSRLDQGRIEMDLKPINICELAKKIEAEVAPLLKDKNLKLQVICDQRHPMVVADEGKLREAIINLLGNSLKFTKSGGITMEQKAEGKMLVTYVSDTGMGIAKERQGLLFRRFQQAMDRTLAREAGGTGLGLYISREFVRLMSGEMWLVKSEPGKGSTFAFSLPLAKS